MHGRPLGFRSEAMMIEALSMLSHCDVSLAISSSILSWRSKSLRIGALLVC